MGYVESISAVIFLIRAQYQLLRSGQRSNWPLSRHISYKSLDILPMTRNVLCKHKWRAS